MAYCDTTFADSYLGNNPFSAKWTGSDKAKYLEQATRLIKEYCYFLDKNGDVFRYDEADTSITIPDWLKQATSEEALYLITLGKDPTAADKKLTIGVQSAEGAVFNKDFAADILCKACIRLLENNGGMISGDATAGNNVSWGYFSK